MLDSAGFRKSGRLDLNQRPLRPERTGDDSKTPIIQAFHDALSAVCTRVCTNEPEMGHDELLESLAAALRGSVPDDDCRRLAELLTNSYCEENA